MKDKVSSKTTSKTSRKSTKSTSKDRDQAIKRIIQIKEISQEAEDGQCRIQVQLKCNGKTVNVERTGPDEPDYRIMMAALCTLDGLMKATNNEIKMELLFLERQLLEKIGREIIMVLIDVNVGDDTRAATGACQVRGEPAETAARAVLDATNRIIELYFNNQ